MSDQPISPLAEEIEALGRIAMTHDGRLMHRFLRRMIESTCGRDVDSALPLHEGGRMFAASLMRHMAEGIKSSGGRDPSKPIDPGDEPLASSLGGVHVSKPRDARRVKLEPGDGWSRGDTE